MPNYYDYQHLRSVYRTAIIVFVRIFVYFDYSVVSAPVGREARRDFHPTVCGLAKWRIFEKINRRTTLEPITKLSYEAINSPLRQTAVSGCPIYLFSISVIFSLCSFISLWLFVPFVSQCSYSIIMRCFMLSIVELPV